MSRKTSDVSLDQLLKEVEQEIDAREQAQATPILPPKRAREHPHSTAALLAGNTPATL